MAGNNVSLAKATPLEKANALIEKVTNYALTEPDFFDSEGIFRQSGEGSLIDKLYAKVNVDPAQLVIENETDFIKFPHNVTGLLKRFVMADNLWSTQASEILLYELNDKLNQKRFDFDLKGVIDKLVENNHLEEAKMLHNVLHMATLVAIKSDKNKMGPPNMFQTYAPWLAGMAKGDDGLFMKLTTGARNVTTKKIDALGIYKESAAVYNQSFDQAYPQVAKKLEEEHANIPNRAISVPSNPTKVATTWLNKAIDWVTRIALPAVKGFFTQKIPSLFRQLIGVKEKTPIVKEMPDAVANKWQEAKPNTKATRGTVVMGSQVRGPLPKPPEEKPPSPPSVSEANKNRPPVIITSQLSSDEPSSVATDEKEELEQDLSKRDKPTI